MKKIIIMSLALFAFALVGCGDKKTDKEKCEEDDKKQWNEEKKECEDKPADPNANGGTTATEYTIKNLLAETVTVSAEGKQDEVLAQNECVKLPADAAKVKVALETNVLCDGSDADASNHCKAANQEVKETKADDASTAGVDESEDGLADAAAMAENCKEMADAAAQ